jgi:hypothetical protein
LWITEKWADSRQFFCDDTNQIHPFVQRENFRGICVQNMRIDHPLRWC